MTEIENAASTSALETRPLFTAKETCRLCGGKGLEILLDLGEQCVGNDFHPPGAPPSPKAPLALALCPSCGLVQLAHSVDKDFLYARYWYRSGVNRTMRNHLKNLLDSALEFRPVREGETVIDIGCNDGTLLEGYPRGVRRIGVDPSNIRPAACDVFVNDYYSFENVREALEGRKAGIITSIAMFYDLDDPRAFAREVRRALADDGVWVLELSYLPLMLSQVSYDTICHEHVTYYRLETFEKVLEGTDLEAADVEFNGCNGGSFRLYVVPKGSRRPTRRLQAAREEERAGGYGERGPYETFREKVELSRARLMEFLSSVQAHGETVYGYGASTKGMVTLQYCRVTPAQVRAVAERNPEKVGMLTPGTEIPICSEEEMRAARPDYLLVLPWHFLPEFLEREKEYLDGGGRMVVPLPEFKVFSWEDGRM